MYWASYLSFLTVLYIHRKKDREREKITKKSLKGQRDRLHPLYQIKSALAGLF